MSEVQATRPGGTRGRGGYRGGRGGFRGGRNTGRSQRADNEQENVPPTSLDDQGEVGDLKRKFGDKVPLLREVCPGWSDEDLVFALQETDGDVEAAVDRISSGSISQWGEVKKKQPKAKETGAASSEGATRGRGRGNLEGRGRGRATERGGRGGRGARAVSQANGTKHSKTTDDSGDTSAHISDPVGGWDSAPTNGDAIPTGDWANDPGKDALASLTTEEPKPAAAAAPTGKKPGGWAGLFAKPPASKPQPPPTSAAHVVEKTPVSVPVINDTSSHEPILPPPIESVPMDDEPTDLPSAPHSDTAADLTPSRDQLTETNLELLPDVSHPPATATAASTVASTQDPLAPADSSKPTIRPGMSGFAASALKATAASGRSASFTRKVMEQHEAVVMPGNHAVEKTAVQFGKMGMNDSDDADVDEEREEPETRTQLPEDSPVAPRTSLPPSLPESQPTAAAAGQSFAEAAQAQRQAPGLPPAPPQAQQAHQPSPSATSAYPDAYKYGQTQKGYDPFGQQPTPGQGAAPNPEPFSNQVPGASHSTATQNDYANYYGREYQNYYGAYAQGQAQGQDTQRTGSGFGTSSQESQGQYATARPQQSYAQQEAQGSGQNTPAPAMGGQQAQHSQHMGSQAGHAGYPYGYPNTYNQQYPQYSQSYMNQMSHRYGANRPMFDDVRRQQDPDYYANQYGYQHNQQYGSNYKSNMYGQQPQQQPYSYEHSSSPANAGAFGGREGSYGRTGSAQPAEAQATGTAGANSFGGIPDPFARSTSGYGQNQGLSQQQHGGHQGGEDASKVSGPSPSIQSGRPGSAVNNAQSQQGGLPPPQSQQSGQQAFGAYPQYGGGLGNFGGHQSGHQNTGYAGYGSNAFGSYGGYGGGRGWNGGNYGSGH